MKTLMKRGLTAALVTSLLLSAAACSGSSGSTTAQSGDSSGGSAASTDAAAQTSGESSSEGVTLHILGPETSNPYIHFADREKYSTWQAFKKLFEERGINPEFEIVASDQYKTTIQTRMASGSNLPDFAQVSSLDDSSIMNYVNMGQFLSITQLMEEGDGTAKAFFETGKGKLSNTLNTTEDGNAYWISQIQATTYDGKPASTSMVVNIRQDWLDKIGQSLPTTADEFYQALKAMQDQDVNGNGQKDEVLAFNPASFQNGIAQWFGLVTDITSFVIEDAKVTSPWYQDGIKDYFKFLNKLASENLMDTSLIGLTTDDQLDQRIAENKASAIFTYAMQTWYEPSVAAEGASYQPLAPLQAAEGITPVNAIEPPNLSYGKWVFTKAVTDQTAAAALLDLLCSEDYQTLTQWGIEGETYEVVDGENQLKDIALNASWEQAASEGKAIGDALWANGSMFPKRRFVPMENEISVVPENKAEFQKEIIEYSPTVPLGNENYLPVMTSEQVETRLGIITDLKTRSEELATQLILGQASLDNWDSYIEELQALGLDQLIEIDQSRLDRYMASLK